MSVSSSVLSPLDSPTSPRSPCGPPRQILFESYLHKTPPLDRIFVSWKKRYFELSRGDPHDPSTIELAYYVDNTKREKRGTVDLTKFLGIRPNAKVGQKENVFAVETQDRKYILRAPDLVTKDIWLAKLCELCGQEQVYHVTVPHQPSVAYNEAILKFSSPTHVTVVAPSSGAKVMAIPYGMIRRISLQTTYGTDVIWFETCKQSIPDQFYFFTVPSGNHMAWLIIQELKSATECCTGTLLIREDVSESELSFISRGHYGCQDFPVNTRGRALNSGLRQLPSTWRSFTAFPPMCPRPPTSAPSSTSTPFSSPTVENPRSLPRRISEPAVRLDSACPPNSISLNEWSSFKERRKHNSVIHPLLLAHRPTLDKFRTLGSASSHDSDELNEGSDSSEVFEPQQSSPSRRQSPSRRLSHQSSVTSQDSSASNLSGSGSSPVYSPSIPENGILEDPFEQEELAQIPVSVMSSSSQLIRRSSAPFVPPRSFVSLKQPQRRKLSAIH